MVADRRVEFRAGLHPIDHVMRAAVARDRRVQVGLRLVRHAQGTHRPDHHLVAHRLELAGGEERGAAELGHIGKQAVGDGAEHLGCRQSLGKDRVGAGLHEQLRARHRAVDALGCRRIGAGDDEQVPAGLCRGGDLGRHVMRVGQLLVVQVAAFLRQQLVFDMHRGGAGILEAAHHVHDVERLAVAGVAIDQQRQPGRAGDLAHEEAHLVHRDDPEIGQAHRGGHRRARQVQRLEPRGLGLQRCLAVMGARQAEDAGAAEQGTQALAGGGNGKISGD